MGEVQRAMRQTFRVGVCMYSTKDDVGFLHDTRSFEIGSAWVSDLALVRLQILNKSSSR